MHFFLPTTSPTASLSSSRRLCLDTGPLFQEVEDERTASPSTSSRPSFNVGRLDAFRKPRGRSRLPQRASSKETLSTMNGHSSTFHQLLQDLAMEFTKLETKCAAYCAQEQLLRAELGSFRNVPAFEQTLKPVSLADAEPSLPPPPEIADDPDHSILDRGDPDVPCVRHEDNTDVSEVAVIYSEVAESDKADLDCCTVKTPTTTGGDEEYCVPTCQESKKMSRRNSTIMEMHIVAVGAARLAIWRFLSDPDSSYPAKIYSLVMNPFYVVTMLVAMAQHTTPPMITDNMAVPLEIGFEIIFAIDIFLRFLVCPSKVAFVNNGFNTIDFFSAIPLLLRIIGLCGDLDYTEMQYILLCVVPILRLLKLQRRFEKFHLVYTAFLVSLEALPVLLYTLLVVILTFSTLIYVAEPRDVMPSLPMAIWFVIVTVSTVGYGEIVPVSTLGKTISSVLIFLSMPLLAIPVGIVGSAFNRVWEDRNRLLLLKRTRVRLQQWGYSADHIPNLFSLFGDDEEGLEFNQFLSMMTHLKLGMSDAEILELFRSFDEDGGGTVDPQEFVQQIFPEDIVGMYKERFETMDRQVSTGSVASERLASMSGPPSAPDRHTSVGSDRA